MKYGTTEYVLFVLCVLSSVWEEVCCAWFILLFFGSSCWGGCGVVCERVVLDLPCTTFAVLKRDSPCSLERMPPEPSASPFPEKVSRFTRRCPSAVLTVGTQSLAVSASCALIGAPGRQRFPLDSCARTIIAYLLSNIRHRPLNALSSSRRNTTGGLPVNLRRR